MTFLDAPTQPSLEIPPDLHSAAWQNRSSSAPAWWNTYLNQVCLPTVLSWLQREYNANAQSELDQTALQDGWQLVNGTALTLESRRVILIPDKSFDISEFRVPQEWVDLPSWAGDYYLAVQVNPDDASVLIWGYTTHEQIKAQGGYDADDRVYCLDAQAMIQDLNVLAVAREICPQETTRAEIAPLPVVPTSQAEALLQRLANPEILHPRLEIPFQTWGALLEHPEWRHQLGQLRLGQSDRTSIIATATSSIVSLGQWLQNVFDEQWQNLENLLGNELAPAYSFRQTAESNRSIVQRAKVLELGEQIVWLSIGLEPDDGDRVSIRVQLRSSERNFTLPAGLTLTLLSNSGGVVQSVEARDQDDIIQLKRFKCALGTQFSLQISLGTITLTEEFVV
jgi:hypothetical protein